ncbi:MAG: thiamine phosphate synthase [Cytophagaceae bacterium]|jgi:thiamine-phosphate pyrophosphorylase|nr:thiamine phosphate synthase [Cytophagaceae bacterium]
MNQLFQWKIFTREISQPGDKDILNALAEFPEVTIHFRKPSYTREAYSKEVSTLSPLAISKTMFHEHHELSLEFDVKGIHYKSHQAIHPIASKLISSKSFHDFDTLLNEGHRHHYAFISPLFPSISKEGYTSSFTSDEIKNKLTEANSKNISVIGLGGISDTNIEQWTKWNLAGVGLLGTIWNNENPITQFERILKIHRDYYQ